MSLRDELKLSKDLISIEHEALLGLYYTTIALKKHASEFFAPFGLTDVQFNLMMMIRHHGGGTGLSQARLSEMMMVNRANVTGLVDRLEKAGMVRRTAAEDRRYNMIQLTTKGKKILDKADPAYGGEVRKIMAALSKTDQKALIKTCEKIRAKL